MSAPAYYVRSSTNPNHFWVVAENPRGFLECDCPAAQFNRTKPCKHCVQVTRGCGLTATPKRAPAPAPVGTVADLYTDGGASLAALLKRNMQQARDRQS